MSDKLNPPAELIAAIAAGEMVVVCDAAERENEGDIIMAADKITPAAINFMVREACGLICLALTPAKCQELELPLMVAENDSPHNTNFTVSVDAKQGIKTGISAADRAKTIQLAAAANAKPTDLARPGHIFPVMANPQGLAARQGHTEAGVALAAAAGLQPAAVIVEIMNPDGTMARLPELRDFAAKHKLKLGSIADLLKHLNQ